MPRSSAQTNQAPCSNCGQSVDLEVWLIIDLAERPDLADRIREGTIHAAPCPHCGNVGSVDAPLLIHDPERQRLLFVPQRATTQEQDHQIAQQLMAQLAEAFLHPRPDYLTQAVAVPRQALPVLFDADAPQAALDELTRQAAEENPLLQAVQVLTEARSPAEVLEVVQEHPALLTDEADAIIRQGIENARQMGQEEMTRHIEARYHILHQIREQGIEPEQLTALAEARDQMVAVLSALPENLYQVLADVSSREELEAAIKAHPELARAQAIGDEKAADQPPLARIIQRFIRSRTWADSMRVVQCHPELLTDEADGLLGQLIEQATAQDDEDAVRVFEEHRALLRRCRETSVKTAFAEKMGLPVGADPLEAAATAQAMAALPEEVRQALAELIGREGITNQEELDAALEAHSELREALARAAQQAAAPRPREAISYAAPWPHTCPACGQSWEPQVWQIVDAEERSDLVERIHDGTLHAVTCPACGESSTASASLLYHDQAEGHLFLVVPEGWDGERDGRENRCLFPLLRAGLGIEGDLPPHLKRTTKLYGGLPLFSRYLRGEADESLTLPPELRRDIQALGPELGRQFLETMEGASSPEEFVDALEKHPQLREALIDASGGPSLGDIPPDVDPILRELSRPARRADIPRRVQLCQQALSLVEPASHPQLWAVLQGELGSDLAQNPLGDRAENIEAAIGAYQQALEVMTREAMPVEWAKATMNLATAYRNRIRGERAENIEVAIEASQQALEVMTREVMPVEWAKSTMNLATAYRIRIRGDRAENIEAAIQAYQQALEVMTREAMPVEWATTTMNLATAYYSRIRGERAENIGAAIQAYQQALEVMTREAMPVEWVMTMMNLATAYYSQIRGERAENIEAAIQAYQQALEVMTREAMPVEWAMTMMNLANAYYSRIRGERAENIEAAIEAYQQALEVRTREAMPVEWATTMINLATAYRIRIRGERAKNIEAAIGAYQQALEVMTREAMPVEWATTINNLATAYYSRIRGERTENIEAAIEAYQQALEVRTRKAMPVEWAQTINNLATAYHNRIRGERAKNIEAAIQAYQQALEVMTREAMPVEWATTMMNLATAHSDRMRGERAENIEAAIQAYQQALEVRTRKAMPVEWAEATMNLATAYYSRIGGERAENIEAAIEAYQQALEVRTRKAMPVEWAQTINNLAIAYRNRIRGERAENIEAAIQAYQQALEVMTREAMPDDHRRTQRNLADLCFGENRWPEAIPAFQGALAAGDLLYLTAVTPEARQGELREIRNLPPRLALALSKTVEEPDDAPLQDAALTLEQNRARWLSEALALHSQKPPDVPGSVWQTFVTHRERIQQLQVEARLPEDTPGKRDYLTLSRELAAAYTALDETVTHIREYDDTFMPAPTFDQIQAAVKADCSLIYFAVTPAGTVALVVTPTAVHPIHTSLTEAELREHIAGPPGNSDGYLGAYATWRRSPHDPTARQTWFSTLDHTTHWLWDALIGPLVHTLADLNVTHATLIPQGFLGLLPLHAAWTEANGKRRYAMDDVCFTYAPNARALSAARQTAARVQPDRLFAVDEPQPVSADPLPNSNAEVSAACEHFIQRKVLGGDSATEQAVRAQLPHHTVLHFSCHGHANFAQPLDGGLLMANDKALTLRGILALRLENARLAVLSACETGIPGTELLDEVISLPTGLAQAGIAGVVASLWSVSDLSTMMLMARFYELWKRDGLEPSAALRQAQLWLRDTTNAQKAEYFKDFLPTSDATRLPAHIADALYKHTILARPDDNDFEHPFYWAAFTYTGV